MYNQSKRDLPSDVRTMALKVAKEMLALQVDAVVSRAWNEMLVAMEQSGLSAKTINKTREKLTEVVLPVVTVAWAVDRVMPASSRRRGLSVRVTMTGRLPSALACSTGARDTPTPS